MEHTKQIIDEILKPSVIELAVSNLLRLRNGEELRDVYGGEPILLIGENSEVIGKVASQEAINGWMSDIRTLANAYLDKYCEGQK